MSTRVSSRLVSPVPSFTLTLLLLIGGGCAQDSDGTSGAGGTTGAAGSGNSGGTAGTTGALGGHAGQAGGTAGTTGTAGVSGTAGTTGTAGTSGAAGNAGHAGFSGTAGTSGAGGKGGGTAGAAGGHGGGATGAAGQGAAGTTGAGGGSSTACGAGDTNLPAEPTIPPACTTLQANFAVPTGLPSESSLDTSRIQTALNGCGAGKAVKLTTNGASNGFITGPLTIPTGVTLWVDTGTTLFGTRDPNVYGSASALITVKGANSGIVGAGTIDGQGGEVQIGGSQSWWDINGGGGSSPALIQVSGATNFTLYQITLHNSPMFHVKLNASGFVVWGIEIKTPSKATNAAGTALNYTTAHNTDGVDPGESASNGYIVCNKITTGDDHIAIKGSGSGGVTKLTIAHNHFGAGHGMSIGSEFVDGVSSINVYDLSIDGMGMGTSGGSSNGIRIKSDSSRGGLVNNVTYSDVCVRNLSNPIFLTPKYSTMTGSDIPQYTNIKISNFHGIAGGSNTPRVTLDGYDSSHLNSVTLDNVVIDGITGGNVQASYTTVTLGPGNVNFTPSGTGVNVRNDISGSSTPNPCTNKWVTF
jgi:polygalacturonase